MLLVCSRLGGSGSYIDFLLQTSIYLRFSLGKKKQTNKQQQLWFWWASILKLQTLVSLLSWKKSALIEVSRNTNYDSLMTKGQIIVCSWKYLHIVNGIIVIYRIYKVSQGCIRGLWKIHWKSGRLNSLLIRSAKSRKWLHPYYFTFTWIVSLKDLEKPRMLARQEYLV